jgi:hypothetical protein
LKLGRKNRNSVARITTYGNSRASVGQGVRVSRDGEANSQKLL